MKILKTDWFLWARGMLVKILKTEWFLWARGILVKILKLIGSCERAVSNCLCLWSAGGLQTHAWFLLFSRMFWVSFLFKEKRENKFIYRLSARPASNFALFNQKVTYIYLSSSTLLVLKYRGSRLNKSPRSKQFTQGQFNNNFLMCERQNASNIRKKANN